jgi:hypothetical protein
LERNKMTAADKQALWDAYLAAAANQDAADHAKYTAELVYRKANNAATEAEEHADAAYEAWENA